MFDLDAGKFLIVGVIALLVIPPKDLPRVLRQAGQFVGKMRRMAADFQGQFMDAMREADMADLRKEAQKLADAARVDGSFHPMHELDRGLTRAVAAKGDKPGPSQHDPREADDPAFKALQSELRPMLAPDDAGRPERAALAERPAEAPHSS